MIDMKFDIHRDYTKKCNRKDDIEYILKEVLKVLSTEHYRVLPLIENAIIDADSRGYSGCSPDGSANGYGYHVEAYTGDINSISIKVLKSILT